ncbi:MAG: TIGR03761 family integrating conjugative element protein [Methylophilaceae bacterium]|nr:TIGR03761 family integrating conjugative element protein [Methylophilaceae bacterium]
MATKKVKFFTTANSPFADGYDMAAEAELLADLINSTEDPSDKHPNYFRFMDYLDRLEELKKRASVEQQRQHADKIVPDHEAIALRRIGGLMADENDVMDIHTREAYRIFIGRAREESPGRYGITSGKRVAAILRSIWNLSASDNPYADWMLVQVYEKMDELRQQMNVAIKHHEEAIAKEQSRGLRVSILKSRAPVEVELGFRSPYGYMIVDLTLDFDYFTRVIKTLVQKNRLSDTEGHEEIRKHTKAIRALFESTLPYQKYLLREELRGLCRADFLPSASDIGRKRVEAARAIFGDVPAGIFTGEIAPRHSKRRSDVTETEMKLLLAVAQGAVSEHEAGTAGSEGGLL